MKIIKFIVIEILLLIAMLVCGVATIVILNILFKIANEDVGEMGLKVGLFAWLILLVVTIIVKLKNRH